MDAEMEWRVKRRRDSFTRTSRVPFHSHETFSSRKELKNENGRRMSKNSSTN